VIVGPFRWSSWPSLGCRRHHGRRQAENVARGVCVPLPAEIDGEWPVDCGPLWERTVEGSGARERWGLSRSETV
jgi:hypothetical protein